MKSVFLLIVILIGPWHTSYGNNKDLGIETKEVDPSFNFSIPT